MVSQTKRRECLSLEYQNRQVNVTLEFPAHSDRRAEQELMDRLKAIYLKKFEVWEEQSIG